MRIETDLLPEIAAHHRVWVSPNEGHLVNPHAHSDHAALSHRIGAALRLASRQIGNQCGVWEYLDFPRKWGLAGVQSVPVFLYCDTMRTRLAWHPL